MRVRDACCQGPCLTSTCAWAAQSKDIACQMLAAACCVHLGGRSRTWQCSAVPPSRSSGNGPAYWGTKNPMVLNASEETTHAPIKHAFAQGAMAKQYHATPASLSNQTSVARPRAPTMHMRCKRDGNRVRGP
eukprot:1437403-Alexandrium_andersonii.AAC.1